MDAIAQPREEIRRHAPFENDESVLVEPFLRSHHVWSCTTRYQLPATSSIVPAWDEQREIDGAAIA